MRIAASNALTLIGFGLVVYGIGRLCVPAAYIAGGVLAVIVAINLARGK